MKANSTDAQALALDEPLPRVRGWWLAFDPGTPPAEVLRAGALLLVGPIEGQEREH